jgi:hypothetical protein
MADVSPTQRGPTDYRQRRAPPVDTLHAPPTGAATASVTPENDVRIGLDPAVIRATLANLLARPPFLKSTQLANFLHFVVEEALAGRGGRIKAYTIATTALGREDSFDPLTDPIVRVEAARLRRALNAYYADRGANDAIKIELPTGTYTPVFSPQRQQHRPAPKQLRQSGREFVAYARANRHLLLLIFAIAVVVSLTVEILDLLIFGAF